jgi:antitoxin CcdA
MRMKIEGSKPRARARTSATNVSLDSQLVAEARELGVNISQASTLGLESAVAKARAERWIQENRSALHSSNAFVDSHGLPLRALRQF